MTINNNNNNNNCNNNYYYKGKQTNINFKLFHHFFLSARNDLQNVAV